jgi:hypothetical protein
MTDLKAQEVAPSGDHQTSRSDANEQNQQQQFKPILSQEDFDKAVGFRLQKEREKFADYAELKKKAEAFDKAEDEKKTELEKLTDKLATAEAEAAALKQASQIREWKTKIRKEKNLDESLDALLTGTTEEEIAKQADLLSQTIQASGKQPKHVVKSDTGKAAEPKAGQWGEVLTQINSQ